MDICRERVTDRQLIKKSLVLALRFGASKVRVEIDKYANLQYGFKDVMKEEHQHITIDCVKTHGHNKNARIKQRLSPMFEARNIHSLKSMKVLEDELFTFPNGAHDDVIDALAWQVEGLQAREYAKPVVDKRPMLNLDANGRMIYAFDDIMKSIRDRHNKGTKYPFQLQRLHN
jgi:phage terminase large subunit-like protein